MESPSNQCNCRARRRLGIVLCAGFICLTPVPVMPGDTPADLPTEMIVDRNTTFPPQVSAKRITSFLEGLPERYTVKVHLVTRLHNHETGQMLTYADILTPLNPDGKPDGTEVHHFNWYQGPERTVTYKNGVKHGTEKEYHMRQVWDDERKRIVTENYVLAEVPWVEGKIHGEKKTFHTNGQVRSRTTYIDGLVTGKTESFDEDGNLVRVINYKDGKKHDEAIDYWPNGNRKRIIVYNKGDVDGVARAYYMSGKPKWERPFKDNLQHGIERQYEEDGTLIRVKYWIEGDPVSKEKYQALSETVTPG